MKKSSTLKVVHESAKDLFDIGLIDAKTMRSFDAKYLFPNENLIPDTNDASSIIDL